ncbi:MULTISPECIES: hypothetical protein [unclassified Streptomyces]|uniref:hypothetical protein n=1 Tax=unclassified Streptomyces TaxID=2593676 RepID=UPI003818F7DB
MTAYRPLAARTTKLLAAGLLSSLLLGCSNDPGGTESEARPTASASGAAPLAPPNVEMIATLTGCEATVRIEAKELREGVCTTPSGKWIVTTFPAEKYKLTWLDTAAMYGGTYLVGTQWVIAGKVEVLKTLRGKVGGELQKLRDMNTPVSPSAG